MFPVSLMPNLWAQLFQPSSTYFLRSACDLSQKRKKPLGYEGLSTRRENPTDAAATVVMPLKMNGHRLWTLRNLRKSYYGQNWPDAVLLV